MELAVTHLQNGKLVLAHIQHQAQRFHGTPYLRQAIQAQQLIFPLALKMYFVHTRQVGQFMPKAHRLQQPIAQYSPLLLAVQVYRQRELMAMCLLLMALHGLPQPPVWAQPTCRHLTLQAHGQNLRASQWHASKYGAAVAAQEVNKLAVAALVVVVVVAVMLNLRFQYLI
jgi:hypothetical protein